MKKMMKRIGAVLLAVAMMAALGVTGAWAADTYSISVPSSDSHSYKVYQVLTGTLASAGSKELGNPAWGADAIAEPGDVNTFIESLSGKSEREVALLVKAKADTTKAGRGTVDKDTPLNNLPAGYYVLEDVTSPLPKNHTKALNIVKVVNDVEVNVKYDTTSSDKEIVSDTLGNGETANSVNGDVDNVSIGDTVNYKIEANVPAKAATDYNYFFFVINDTLSEGLTFTEGSIKVYKDSIDDANLLTENTNYEVKYNQNDHTFDVGLINAKSYAGQKIIVTYSAVLNENAKIGEEANLNTSTVQFSNNPNHDYDGDTNDDGKPDGFPDQKDNDAIGVTPQSTTETYTTGIEITKVDPEGNALKGAEFTITGDSVQAVMVSNETFTADAAGEYWKLKDGTYTKTAPVTADTMVAAEAGATKGYVEDANATGEGVMTVGGKIYRPYVPEEDAGKPVYVLNKANSDLYDSTETKYKKTVTFEKKDTTAENVTATAEVGDDGVVTFKGLGAGTYTITETKTPAGYNTIQPLTLKIDFTADPADGAVHWSKSVGNATYNSSTGVFEMTIENKKGTQLPETGGIGTYVFYIVGATIMAISAGLLITRRKKA